MISGEFNPGQIEAVKRRLDRVYDAARRAVDGGVRDNTFKLATYVQDQKLRGAAGAGAGGKLPLGTVSGLLRRSLQPPLFETSGDTTTGIIGRTMPGYGKAFEVGFHGTVLVKAHERMMTKAFGRLVKDPRKIAVAAHDMKMNIPARHFLKESAQERGPAIVADIRKRVMDAVAA